MKVISHSHILTRMALMLALSSSLTTLCSAKDKALASEPARGHESVEMFHAIAEGLIEVDLICLDSTKANVLFKNKTDKPLAIKLPEAFAGVPVLAQFDIDADFDAGAGGGGGGGNQAAGGGFGGGGGGGLGGGGGFFNVDAEKGGKLKVATVCLEHGKADPNPRIKYQIKPIESFTSNAELIQVCRMLGRGEIPQNAAQAAAWHLANGLSWEQLARKNRYEGRLGTQKWFTFQELVFAQQIVAEADRRVKQDARPPKDPTTLRESQTARSRLEDLQRQP